MPRRAQKSSLKERRRRARRITALLSGALALAIIGFVATVLRIPETKIVSVSVSETVYVTEPAVQRLAFDFLAGSYALLVPRTHSFFAPLSSMRRGIEETFPSVRSVTIERDTLRALHIVVTEEVPAFLWCAPEGAVYNGCFFMNDAGYIFAAARADNERLVRYAGTILGNPVGVEFLAGEFPALNALVERIGQVVGGTVRAVSVDEHDDVRITFADGAELLFVRTAESDVLLDAILSVFSSQKMNTERRLEYADFRFGNKIFVKFHNEE